MGFLFHSLIKQDLVALLKVVKLAAKFKSCQNKMCLTEWSFILLLEEVGHQTMTTKTVSNMQKQHTDISDNTNTHRSDITAVVIPTLDSLSFFSFLRKQKLLSGNCFYVQ